MKERTEGHKELPPFIWYIRYADGKNPDDIRKKIETQGFNLKFSPCPDNNKNCYDITVRGTDISAYLHPNVALVEIPTSQLVYEDDRMLNLSETDRSLLTIIE